MVFGFLKSKAQEQAQKFSGSKDFLEGLCSACALTAAAEGGIDDNEYDQTLNVIRANKVIGAAGFSGGEIESVFSKMTPKTGTRSGKAELKQEIRECIARDKTGELGTAIMYAALDVADTGGISAAEETVMKEIAEICGVNYAKLAAG